MAFSSSPKVFSAKSFFGGVFQKSLFNLLTKSEISVTAIRSITISSQVLTSKRFVSRSTSNLHETPPIEVGVRTESGSPLVPKTKWEEKSELRKRIAGTGELPTVRDALRDFRYKLVTDVRPEVVDDRFKGVRDDQRPVVLLCGWAGATPKNLHKYSEIYHRAGCITLDYNLPSRFVFTETSEVPHVARRLLKVIQENDLLEKPLFLHLMSDTGLMAFQGLDLVAREQNKRLNIAGTILDSCPGPRPEGTIVRLLTYAAVNWICSVKDGLPLAGCLKETSRFAKLRIFPSITRYFRGLPVELSMMNETWAGDFYRDAKSAKWPELFIYSKSDAYLPYEYLENKVLAPRKEVGRDFRTKFWVKSPHVAHLRANPGDYEKAVLDFVFDKYFEKILKK